MKWGWLEISSEECVSGQPRLGCAVVKAVVLQGPRGSITIAIDVGRDTLIFRPILRSTIPIVLAIGFCGVFIAVVNGIFPASFYSLEIARYSMGRHGWASRISWYLQREGRSKNIR